MRPAQEVGAVRDDAGVLQRPDVGEVGRVDLGAARAQAAHHSAEAAVDNMTASVTIPARLPKLLMGGAIALGSSDGLPCRGPCDRLVWTATGGSVSFARMRLSLTALAAVLFVSPAIAAGEDMAGWYLVMVIPSGKVTVNQHPMTETGCQQQLTTMRSIAPDTMGECVDLKLLR